MEQNTEIDIRGIIFYFTIALIIVLCFYVIYKIRNEEFKCIISPLTYGVSHLASSNGQEVTCQCSFQGSKQVLYVTKDNISTYNIHNLI